MTDHRTRRVTASAQCGPLSSQVPQPCRRAFTLIEILVVVAMIAMLMALLLPSLSQAREQARSVMCLSNLRELSRASHYYTTANNGTLVPAYGDYEGTQPWWPTWMSESRGLGKYVYYGRKKIQGRDSVFQCPTFPKDVQPLWNPAAGSRSDFHYSPPPWTTLGNRSSNYPPLTHNLVRIGPGPSRGRPGGDPAKLGRFPRPSATLWAMDGNVLWQSAVSAWYTNPYANYDQPSYIFIKNTAASSGQKFETHWKGHNRSANIVSLDGHAISTKENPPQSTAGKESYFGGGMSPASPNEPGRYD